MWHLRTLLTLVLAVAGAGVSAGQRTAEGQVSVRGHLAAQHKAVSVEVEKQLVARSGVGSSSGAGGSDAPERLGNGGKIKLRKPSRPKRSPSRDQVYETPAEQKKALARGMRSLYATYGPETARTPFRTISRPAQPTRLPLLAAQSASPSLTRTFLGGMNLPAQPPISALPSPGLSRALLGGMVIAPATVPPRANTPSLVAGTPSRQPARAPTGLQIVRPPPTPQARSGSSSQSVTQPVPRSRSSSPGSPTTTFFDWDRYSQHVPGGSGNNG